MQTQFPPAVIASVILVVIVLLGVVGWTVVRSQNTTMDAATIAAHQAAKKASGTD